MKNMIAMWVKIIKHAYFTWQLASGHIQITPREVWVRCSGPSGLTLDCQEKDVPTGYVLIARYGSFDAMVKELAK